MRRLPLYFIIDISLAAKAKNIVYNTISNIIENLKYDSYASETVYVSLIEFSSEVNSIFHLFELNEFNLPPFSNSDEKSSLNVVLDFLMIELETSIVKSTPYHKGDFHPIILLFTECAELNKQDDVFKRWTTFKHNIGMFVIACTTPSANSQSYQLISEVINMNESKVEHYLQFIKWVDQEIGSSDEIEDFAFCIANSNENTSDNTISIDFNNNGRIEIQQLGQNECISENISESTFDSPNIYESESDDDACLIEDIPSNESRVKEDVDNDWSDVSWMEAFEIGIEHNAVDSITYIPDYVPNNKIEQINHSIFELKYKILEEKGRTDEQIKSIRKKINIETEIIEGIIKASNVSIGKSIIRGIKSFIDDGIWSIFSTVAIGCIKNENEIAKHQNIINELNFKLSYLQNQSDERVTILQNQLDEYIALKEDAINVSDVYSSVFAPAEVKRKSHLQVQIYLHLYEEVEKVKSLAKEADKNAERRDCIPLSLRLRKCDKVDVEFNIYGESRLMSERKSTIWQGSFTKCSFDYFVPENIDVDELSCETNVFVNGAMIGEMRFLTQIVDTPRNLNPEILSHRFNRIFISYAHQDAQQIKLLALAYKAQGVDYFYDRDSLAPGDIYEEKIFDYIDSSDLFVLCWSKNAALSDYVAKEKGRALLHAYPHLSLKDATLKICPISIEPRAELPSDMKEVYNFEII